MANLDPALQDSIDNLQTRHTALVDAVRNYTGGSIAGATNDLLAARDDVSSAIDEKETALLGLIQANTTKPVPSLLFDYKNQIYMQGTRRLEHGYAAEDLQSIQRAGSTWVWGPQGNVVEVSPDTLAYEYDPVTGEPLGVRSGEGRTNLMPWSETNGVRWPIRDSATAWAGTPTVMRGITLDKYVLGNISLTDLASSSNVATWSVFFYDGGEDLNSSNVIRGSVRGDTNTGRTVIFDYSTKSFSMDSVTGVESLETIDLGGGLYHVTLTIDDPSIINVTVLRTAIYGDNKWLGGFQLEESKFASAYIRTTVSPVTRAPDDLLRELGDEFVKARGTIVIELTPDFVSNNCFYFSFQQQGPSRDLAGYFNSDGNINVAGLTWFGVVTPGSPFRVAVTWENYGEIVRASVNGLSAKERVGTDIDMRVVDFLRIAMSYSKTAGSFGMFNGTVSYVALYPVDLTSEQLEQEALV